MASSPEGDVAIMSQSEMSGQEPVMCLQRPSSARSQDVRHILADTFRQLYARDIVGMDTVNYLHQSRGSDDDYHEKYVLALKNVQDQRDKRLAEAAMLERHIMQAQARAMSADEKALNRVSSSHSGFPDLGLPPPRAHFRSCIDSALLRKHNLITPEDFSTEEVPPVPPPSGPPVPSYARDTASSNKKKDERDSMVQSPLVAESDQYSWVDDFEYEEEETNVQTVNPDTWKKQINPEERESGRRELANLQRQVDYLKNPRHIPPSAATGGRTLIKSSKKRPKEVGIKPKPLQSESAKEPSVVFLASPSVVTFSDYKVSKVYELTLELKNVTTVMRPVRLIPPKTNYFSVGLGQFPSDHGLIAPGMSCHFKILFSPDSLKDFDDELTFHTQSSHPLIVKLEGRRPPPKLTLPETIKVGQCLVGGLKVSEFSVKNNGGVGRFCLMPKSSWPTTNFKSVTSLGCVSMPAFEVRPAVFELDNLETTVIEVLFTPDAAHSYSEGLSLVCDNCQIKHFDLEGEGVIAEVKVLAVEGGMSVPEPGELCDITAQHLVKFEMLNPYTYIQRKLTVHNPTEVELPFEWAIVKPFMKPPNPDGEEEDDSPAERVVDGESVFSIEPPQGTLPSSGTVDFVITFAPPMVEEFHNVLHLLLRNIPEIPQIEESEYNAKKAPTPLKNKGLPHKKPPPPEPVGLDKTVLEVEVKGECMALSVVLQPYAVHIPGQLLVETAIKHPIMMINQSISPIIFQWENVGSSYVLEVEPPIGEIGPQCELPLELTISGSEPGKIDHTLLCHVQHLEEPLILNVQADIKGPEVVIEQADINFGLVRFGESGEQVLTLRNTARVPAKWAITEARQGDEMTFSQPCRREFTFTEMSGELKPLEQKDLSVTFTPSSCSSLQTIFELRIEDGNNVSVMVLGEVQQPSVCLKKCQVRIEDVYLDVPVCHQVALLNKTLLPTGFHWGQVEGGQSDQVTVSIDPEFGELKSREELDISIQLTAQSVVELTDVRVPCFIEDTKQPLFLSLSGSVLGLSVSYVTSTSNEQNYEEESNEESLELRFGENVCLSENPKRYVYIRNNSAISAHFTANVAHFVARPPTPPSGKPDGYVMSRGSQRRPMLSETPNLSDPHTKTAAIANAELNRAILRDGLGAAFLPEPMSGILPPFGLQRIEVTAFSNMWGAYTDKLIFKVGELEDVEIPMYLTTEGCPLQFQMVAAQPQLKQPTLRFGMHVSGVGPITRQMRINNTSPYDLRVDWQMFNLHKEDRQLLDLIVSYGESFPLKDENGDEIVPTVEEPAPVWRQPTEFIPDSPDSTPAVSRTVTEMMSETTPTLEERRPNVISLTLREHIGEQSSSPYSVTHSQLVVPKKHNRCVTVNFMPFPTWDVNGDISCHSLGLGYISLPDTVSTELGVERLQGYSIPPIRLEITGQVKPALLTIECTEDEGMSYTAAMSDIVNTTELGDQCLKLRGAILRNQTETPLKFHMECAEPFQLVMQRSDGGKLPARLFQTEKIYLLPRHNMPLQVGFCVNQDLLQCLDTLSDETYQSSEAGTETDKDVYLEVHGTERKLHFKHDLIIHFNNGSQQKLPLYAKLAIPTLSLSKETIDFGTCLVGQERECQFMLTNPTGSDSYWNCRREWMSDTCIGDTFFVTPQSGCLNAFITHISKNKVLLKVFFTAKHSEDYEAMFVFSGRLGEQPHRLQVLGQGSYDGKHQAVVNV